MVVLLRTEGPIGTEWKYRAHAASAAALILEAVGF